MSEQRRVVAEDGLNCCIAWPIYYPKPQVGFGTMTCVTVLTQYRPKRQKVTLEPLVRQLFLTHAYKRPQTITLLRYIIHCKRNCQPYARYKPSAALSLQTWSVTTVQTAES